MYWQQSCPVLLEYVRDLETLWEGYRLAPGKQRCVFHHILYWQFPVQFSLAEVASIHCKEIAMQDG